MSFCRNEKETFPPFVLFLNRETAPDSAVSQNEPYFMGKLITDQQCV